VFDGKRAHAWINPVRPGAAYAHKPSGNPAIGSLYTAQVTHTGANAAPHGTRPAAARVHRTGKPTPVEHPDLPPEVLATQPYARGSGRHGVLFDADADHVGDRPTWAW